jgi:hypothetical protein
MGMGRLRDASLIVESDVPEIAHRPDVRCEGWALC